MPGYGAQGGKGADAAASFDENGRGAIVNNSRGIIAAYKTDKYKGMTYYAAARAAATAMARIYLPRSNANKSNINRNGKHE